jgi:hypothetical protein
METEKATYAYDRPHAVQVAEDDSSLCGCGRPLADAMHVVELPTEQASHHTGPLVTEKGS